MGMGNPMGIPWEGMGIVIRLMEGMGTEIVLPAHV